MKLKNILNSLEGVVKKNQQKIIFPESTDQRILEAASIIKKRKIATPILIGCRQEIEKIAKKFNINIDGLEVKDPKHDIETKNYSELLFELRKDKGITEKEAQELILEPIYFGVLMIKSKHADGLVSGATHSTANTLRPALQILKTRQGISLASSFFLMITKRGPMLFADCAININPNSEELANIARNTADSSEMFDIIPKVALLSFSTKGSGEDESVTKVQETTKLLKDSKFIFDGELQVDTALVPEVAKLKAKDSSLQGDANVLIFPDLNSGNIGYKLVERLGDASAIGPIMQGLNGAVNDLSRGCSVEDIVNVTIITALQAIKLKDGN